MQRSGVFNLVVRLSCLHVVLAISNCYAGDQAAVKRPNVLMIAIDDLNDWIEPLEGHPQVKTPGFNRLASRAVTFTNAHCQAPLCNPSRTSLLTSRRPSSTGIYGLEPWFRNVPELSNLVTLPQAFHNAGYVTMSAGKVFHGNSDRQRKPNVAPEFDRWGPASSTGIRPPQKLVPPTPAGNHPLVDWGVFDHRDDQKGDWQIASWTTEQLEKCKVSDPPFFMAIGFFLPHVPCHVTQKWWDMYPEASLAMPVMTPNDRRDCSPFSWYLHWNIPEPRLSWLEQQSQHQNLVRAYLASISFMDSQLERVLVALENSSAADNTIVVVWSDHGFHLGEKEMTSKNTLWERSTRVPLLIAGPGIQSARCSQPVELLDLYPTLTELAGVPTPTTVEGISLVPQLRDPDSPHRPAITDHNQGNSAVRDQRYRLIHYADGSEELYDLQVDPHEFVNQIENADFAQISTELRRHLPNAVAPAPGSAHRVLERRDGKWWWEGSPIDRAHPPMDIGSTSLDDLPD